MRSALSTGGAPRTATVLTGVALAAVALAIATVCWAGVVASVREATPIASTIEARGVVWGDRVFVHPRDLARWLRTRGVGYHTWATRHPRAAARLAEP